MSLLLTVLGIVLIVVGVFWLLGGSLLGGIVLIVVGLVLASYAGNGAGYWGSRRL